MAKEAAPHLFLLDIDFSEADYVFETEEWG